MSKKKIIIIGGGFAGLKATKTLSKALKNDAEITLIDKHSYQTSMTQLHEVAAGRVPFTTVQFDFNKLLGRRKNVTIVTDEVTKLDKTNKVVTTSRGQYEYDYVIVAMGGEPNDFGVKGVKEHGFTLWSLENAMTIKRQLERMVQKASTELNDEKRKAMLTFSVAGSGFTGIEMAGELIEWREVVARDWKIDESDITINVIEMMPSILNMLDRRLADKALKHLEKKNVNVLLNHGITEVGQDFVRVNVGTQDEEKVEKIIPTHTLIWTTGVQGNTQAQAYELTESERGSRLMANDYMEAEGHEGKGIYVAGDVSAHMTDGRPQPQIVEAAEQTGHTAAMNIIADIKGGDKHKFVGKYQGTLVSIGSRWGVAKIGNVKLSGFLAMFMKSIVYIMYTLQIRSAYYLFTYIRNEIFTVKSNRNFMYGHTSRMGNVLWAVPLRIFYGFVWLMDAWPKVFGNSDQSWFTSQNRLVTMDWLTKSADAASGASVSDSASTAAATTATSHGVFSLSYVYGQDPLAITNGVPGWLKPLFKFMIPNQDVALFMQKFMSILELLLALALIFGAFTFLSSFATAGLVVMFSVTGMFYWVNIWMIPVAIVLMMGAGRAFGLDYWIQPWLQKVLGKIWYGKSKSIYNG
ncbi:MAG: NAD(P)/FAD-dependent oxidoreductase [Streptococcaceae bacterium]|nr:NAD(P)/FAD-dependent oxidoreductase [Streptococcaceae bacterium]